MANSLRDILLMHGWLLIVAVGPPLWAADTLVLKAKLGRSTTRSVGEIVEYNDTRLLLRHAGGREEAIDPARVLEISTEWTPSYLTAEEHFQARRFQEALASYKAAYSEDSRSWVRQRILARCVWCARSMGETEQAIDLFLALFRLEFATPEFDCIPLSWTATQPAAGLDRKLRQLLAGQDLPVGQLIGASWLLSTDQRTAAMQTLRELLNKEDARLAALAEAQLWRTQIVTVKAEDVARWQRRVARMPAKLRAGPSHMLGQALATTGDHQAAAIELMRAPILFPLDRPLAAQSLLAAARELEKMDASTEAAHLYREVVTEHQGSPAAMEAQQRLEHLSKNLGK